MILIHHSQPLVEIIPGRVTVTQNKSHLSFSVYVVSPSQKYVNIGQAFRKLYPVFEFRLDHEFACFIYHSPIRASFFRGKSQPFRKLPNISKPGCDDHLPGLVNKSPLVADSNRGKPLAKFAPDFELRGDCYVSGAIYVSV